jgi:hypothetical protein
MHSGQTPHALASMHLRSIRLPCRVRGRALPWALLLLAIAAAAGAWWYYAPDTLPGFVRAQLPVSPKSNPVLYKWRDAKGRLHVTDTPPTDRPFETLRYDPKVNVVPSMVPPPGTTQ